MKIAFAKTLLAPILIACVGCSLDESIDNSACISAFMQTGERNAHALIFDDSSGNVVLFGGASASSVCGDTWEWDGSSWENTEQSGPPPRTFPAMAQDPNLGLTYLFGGNRVLFGESSWWPFSEASTLLDDFWIRSNESWQQVELVGDAPSARAEAAITFDSFRNRLVLFGGYAAESGEVTPLGDTWEYDGNSWQLMSSSGPTAANGATLVYDTSRQRSVLFTRNAEKSKSETWEWDGSQWEYIASADSPPRYNVALSFDDDLEQVVRFGGWDGSGRVAETWLYDGETWTQVEGEGPSARNHSVLIWDSQESRSLLYGGHNGTVVHADMWQFTEEGWTQLIKRAPVARVDNGH